MLSREDQYALFIDIDDTLTVENYVIPEKNIEALGAARALGHKVFINTGRSGGNIPPIIFEQLQVDGVISGNGTVVTVDGKTVYSCFFTREQFEQIASWFFAHPDFWAVFEGIKRSYTIPGRGRKPSPIEVTAESFEELMEKTADDSFQVVAFCAGVDSSFFELLQESATVFRFRKYFDAVRKGHNKALAMDRAVEVLGIKPENTIAIGDSENDLNMIKKAGTGVAVANAMPAVLEAADFVTASNREAGVAQAVEKLLLRGEL